MTANGTITFKASVSIKDGVTGATTQAEYRLVPAPGAVVLLGLAGALSRRTRR